MNSEVSLSFVDDGSGLVVGSPFFVDVGVFSVVGSVECTFVVICILVSVPTLSVNPLDPVCLVSSIVSVPTVSVDPICLLSSVDPAKLVSEKVRPVVLLPVNSSIAVALYDSKKLQLPEARYKEKICM